MNMMKEHSQRSAHTFSLALLVLISALSVPEQVRADDTEVFFPTQVVPSTTSGANPNVMFFIDTSGSMSSTDGQSETRLKRVQNAFVSLMDDLPSNINVGLMRFSGSQGGAVVFPVAPIDATVASLDTVGGNQIRRFTTISSSTGVVNEADQVVKQGAGAGNAAVGTFNFSGTTNTSYSLRLGTDASRILIPLNVNDEAEEHSGNAVDAGATTRCSSDLDFAYESNDSCGNTGSQPVGIRFPAAKLPKGATVLNSNLVVTDNGTSSTNNPTIVVAAQNSNDASAFTNNSSNVTSSSGRPRTGTVSFSPPDENPDVAFASPNLVSGATNIIQTVLANSGWNETNSNLALIVTSASTSARSVYGVYSGVATCPTGTSYSAGTCGTSYNNRPKLAVTFSHATPTTYTSNQLKTALRFENVQIPKGTTIQSAFLEFHNAETIDTRDLRLKIQIDNVDNSLELAAADTTSTKPITSGRSLTGAVLWDVPARSKRSQSISTGTPRAAGLEAGDIKSLIQTVVNRSGWCGGNAMTLAFEYESGDGAFNAVSASMDPALAPVLRIAISPTDTALTTGCNASKVTSQINVSPNDAAETAKTNAVTISGTTLNLGCTDPATKNCATTGIGKTNQYIGLRFDKIAVLKNTTIKKAYIKFVANNSDTATTSLLIRGHAVDNSPAFSTTASDINNRRTAATTASVTWDASSAGSPMGSWTTGGSYQTPELKAILQEIVNRSGWQQNNSVSFIIEGYGRRRAYPMDGKASAAPKLYIEIEGNLPPETVRDRLKEVVMGFIPDGATPTVAGIYEAARYFRGEDAYYGRTRGFGNQYDTESLTAADHMAVSTRFSLGITSASTADSALQTRLGSGNYGTDGHFYPAGCSDFNLKSEDCSKEAWTGTTTYKSPISNGCQSNNLVFLSDGDPNQLNTSDGQTTAKAKTEALLGKTCATYKNASNSTMSEWSCAPDLAEYMNTKDQIPDSGTATAARPVIAGAQNVHTYTIAFGPDVAAGSTPTNGAQFLNLVATKGGGQAFAANNAAELTTAFNTIVGNILDINTTFVAPSVTVNTFNRLTNRNELYFAVFKPNSSAYWAGNLKRYQLFQKSTDSTVRIYDNTPTASGGPIPAVDDNTGFFRDTDPKPISFWSATADGASVDLGGAASKIDQATRKVYTYVSSTAPSEIGLSTSTNYLVSESNSLLTNAVMGLDDAVPAEDLSALLKWARGVDVKDDDGDGSVTDSRTQMGDPLHSEPQLITYGGTDTSPDITLFVSDNVGGLHAINTSDGTEYFSFLPQEVLPNLNTFYADTAGYLSRPIGLDGAISTWINDANKNGKLVTGTSPGTLESGEFAYLYIGMRRGGSSYYALDVSNRTAPKLKFQIKGGTGDYLELGQTWSKAIRARARINKVNKDVLIFSGGYDTQVDSLSGQAVTPNASGAKGRALFVADATNGNLLWWAGFDDTSDTISPNLTVPQMEYAVSATPRVVDLDNDGYVDRIYIADMGGQIFRFVLGKDSTDTSTSKSDGINIDKDIRSFSNTTAQRIAHLAGTDSNGLDAHRFYATPDAALITTGTPTPFISLSIGSGYREHPLTQNTEDRFYVLRDPDTSNDSTTTFDYTESNLYDATTNDISLVCAVGDSACNTKKSAATTALGTASTVGTKKGFYIKLNNPSSGALTGEKVLSESLTFSNQILFATFQPGVTTGLCSAIQGLSRLYQISVLDGTPTQALSSPAGTDKSLLVRADRNRSLKQGGLPPNPTLLFPSISSYVGTDGTRTVCTGSQCLPNQALLCVGAECLETGLAIQTVKTSWQKIEN